MYAIFFFRSLNGIYCLKWMDESMAACIFFHYQITVLIRACIYLRQSEFNEFYFLCKNIRSRNKNLIKAKSMNSAKTIFQCAKREQTRDV